MILSSFLQQVSKQRNLRASEFFALAEEQYGGRVGVGWLMQGQEANCGFNAFGKDNVVDMRYDDTLKNSLAESFFRIETW